MNGVDSSRWSPELLMERSAKVASCVCVVKADGYESLSLWRMWSSRANNASSQMSGGASRIEWSGTGAGGPSLLLGEVDGRPMRLDMTVDEIEGLPVCFIEAPSQVVDWGMVESFLDATMPGVPRFDAKGFDGFVALIPELKSKRRRAMGPK